MTYIFVGGSECSGTSLLQSILCSDDAANPLIAEAQLFRLMVEAYRDGKQHFEVRAKDYFADFDAYRGFHAQTVRRFLETTRNRYASARRLVLKEPTLTQMFPELHELIPEARFVLIVRDPRDTVASLIKVSERMGDRAHPLSGFGRDMRRYARYYRSFYRPAFNYRDTGFRENLCVVKYEDLVLQTTSVLDQLQDFTKLKLGQFDPGDPWKRSRINYDALVSHEEHRPCFSELRGKPLSAARVGVYREALSPDELQAVERECADYLERFRYKAPPAPTPEPAAPAVITERSNGVMVVKPSRPSGKALVTLATDKYVGIWEKYCQTNWAPYAEKHGLDIIVLTERISPPEARHGRTVHWDKCLILSQDYAADYDAIAWLDSDIVINHYTAPSVFDGWDPTKVRALSLVNGIPDLERKNARVTELRRRWVNPRYGEKYIDVPAYYRKGGYESFPEDYINGGVMLFSVTNHRTFLETVFAKYEDAAQRDLSWMEQTAVSYELFTQDDLHQPLPYAFNTLWDLEVGDKYPFLYFEEYNDNKDLAAQIRQTAILNTYFMHFLGLKLEKFHFTQLLDPEREEEYFGLMGGEPLQMAQT